MPSSLWWLRDEYKCTSSCHVSRNKQKLNSFLFHLKARKKKKRGRKINMLQWCAGLNELYKLALTNLARMSSHLCVSSEDSCSVCLWGLDIISVQHTCPQVCCSVPPNSPVLPICWSALGCCIYCSLLRSRPKQPEVLQHFLSDSRRIFSK